VNGWRNAKPVAGAQVTPRPGERRGDGGHKRDREGQGDDVSRACSLRVRHCNRFPFHQRGARILVVGALALVAVLVTRHANGRHRHQGVDAADGGESDGIGGRYGIYLFSSMQDSCKKGCRCATHYEAHDEALPGTAITSTASVAIGVATWEFSPLKFQPTSHMLTSCFEEHVRRSAAAAWRVADPPQGRGAAADAEPTAGS